MYAITLDDNNRILRATFPKYASETDIIVDSLPTGETEKEKDITNWLYIDEQYVYDPVTE